MYRASKKPDPSLGGDDLIVTQEPLVGGTVANIGRMFGLQADAQQFAAPENWALLSGIQSSTPGNTAVPRGFSRAGFRHFVPPELGSGYRDFFHPLPHVILSATDCQYLKPFWVPVHGENVFKIRLLCAGTFRDPNRELFLQGPAVNVAYHARHRDWGYFFEGGVPQRVVILNFAPEAFADTLGLSGDDVPQACRAAIAEPDQHPLHFSGHLSEPLLEAALDILESRFRYSGGLRLNFLEAKCREIITIVLNEARERELRTEGDEHLSSRDRLLIGEATDYLTANYRSPPPIPVLARRIGMNQTKLKSVFKRVTGSTIHDYVQNIRMRRAAAMLSSGDYSISEVAYEVGYEHPANFTAAFKRHFGFLPRVMKPRQAT